MAIFNRKNKYEKMPEKQTAGLEMWLSDIKKSYIKYMTKLGAHVFHLTKHTIYRANNTFKKIKCLVAKRISKSHKKLVCVLKNYLDRHFGKYILDYRKLKAEIAEKKKLSGTFSSILLFISSSLKSIWSLRGFFVRAFNYVAPVVSIIFLVNVVSYASNVQYGISVECNGEVLGFVSAEADLDLAQNVLQERITYVNDEKKIEVEPKLSVKKMESENEVVSTSELADKLITNSDTPVIEAFGFYINGEFQGAVLDKAKIQSTLDGILNKYKTGVAGEVVEFVDKFELKEGLYLEDGIIEPATIVNTLNSQKQVEAYYSVVSGDAPSSIAEKVGVPYAELKKLNPNIEASCKVGDQILLNRSEPFASVRVTRTENYDVTLDYQIIKIDDPNRYKGTETVLVKGVEGSAHVTADVSFVNGYEESREIVNQEIISSPVDKKVAVGTKSTGASAYLISSSGQKLLWPTGAGYVSQGYFSYHRGIDIAAPYGTPIYAAEDGVVTMSQWYSGYGKCVQISHGGGMSTLYGHASKLIVSAGTSVKKGDLIAYVGSTGQSTGNHLHFEVRSYGTKLNPYSFLGK